MSTILYKNQNRISTEKQKVVYEFFCEMISWKKQDASSALRIPSDAKTKRVHKHSFVFGAKGGIRTHVWFPTN